MPKTIDMNITSNQSLILIIKTIEQSL